MMKTASTITICHVHTDEKFVYATRLFDLDFVQNHVFFIGDPTSYNGASKAGVHFFKKDKVGLGKLVNECSNADIVVLYELDHLKAYIANRISKSVKIIWRFFGTELYARLPTEEVYSTQTLQFLRSAKALYRYKRRFLIPVKHWLLWQTNIEAEFKRAVRRIDFFIGLSEDEHRYLKDRFPELPQFLQYPFLEANIEESVIVPNSNRLIIGNSRNAVNNHLDILDILESVKNHHNLEYTMLFSYGVENEYTQEVRIRAKHVDTLTLIENFLDRQAFVKLYENACALVINGYRQMAMGNIFVALRKGIKIYLNEKNVIYSWLCKEGFEVYKMKTLEQDISSGNVRLDAVTAEHNRKQFVALVRKYNYVEFRDKIRQIAFD